MLVHGLVEVAAGGHDLDAALVRDVEEVADTGLLRHIEATRRDILPDVQVSKAVLCPKPPFRQSDLYNLFKDIQL